MKKVLFIDRDGTVINEPPDDFQVDSLEKLEFMPGVFRNLYFIRKYLDYELVMVSNQDGLGAPAYPEDAFRLVQDKMLKAFKNEGIEFDHIFVDHSLPGDNAPTRKPGLGMLKQFLQGNYDLVNSWVIGDRQTDVEMARNLGARAILYTSDPGAVTAVTSSYCSLITNNWDDIFDKVAQGIRTAHIERKTGETTIDAELNLDGTGNYKIDTGIGFFDHMISQLARHSGCDLKVHVKGDLEVDEHHTIEDTAIALGEALYQALGDKRGIERYGFALPMDDCQAQVLIDFGGRPWLVWDAVFNREKIGEMPTEMFMHFFKSFSDAARCNLNISAMGTNEHHKIEAIFKALARALKMAIRKDVFSNELPTTKGIL